MKKDEKTNDSARSVADTGLIEAALAAVAEAPDIPSDVDDMSSEDWTALNGWMRAVRESKA